MVKDPGLALSIEPAAAWSASGPCADRALAFAKTCCDGLGILETFAITVDRCPVEHIGLGTGTQLGLAVARAITLACGQSAMSVTDLAKLVGRGRRSALGIHGFAQGGFLVEAGKRDPHAIAPLVARLPFPDDWRVLLVVPHGLQGAHGGKELEAFDALGRLQPGLAATDNLCRLVLLGMLPAIVERDLEAFGAALHDFNRRAGEMFRPWQGDIYSHPEVAKVIRLLRSAGVKGVGHSSWGPAVFAVVAAGEAAGLGDWLTRDHGFEQGEILVTSASNTGSIS